MLFKLFVIFLLYIQFHACGICYNGDTDGTFKDVRLSKCFLQNVDLTEQYYFIDNIGLKFINQHHYRQSITDGGPEVYCSSLTPSTLDDECFNSCVKGNGTASCSGNIEYCYGRHCVNRLQANCECRNVTINTELAHFYNDREITNVFLGSFGYVRPITRVKYTRQGILLRTREIIPSTSRRLLNYDVYDYDSGEYNTSVTTVMGVPSTDIIQIYFSAGSLVYYYIGNPQTICYTIVISNNLESQNGKFCGQTDSVILDHDLLIGNPSLSVTLKDVSGTTIATKSVPLPVLIDCPIKYCYFCKEGFTQFHCAETGFKVTFILVWIAILGPSLIAIVYLMKVLLVCAAFCTRFGCNLCGCCNITGRMCGCFKRVSSSVKDAASKAKSKDESRRNSDSSDKSSLIKTSKSSEMTILFGILCLCIPVSGYNVTDLNFQPTCTFGVTVPSDITKCSKSGGLTSCSVSYNFLTSLPSTGMSSCVDLVDQTSLLAIGRIVIEFKHVEAYQSLNFAYDTFSFNTLFDTTKACDGTDNCGSPTLCPTCNRNDMFSPMLMRYSGFSSGHTSCGGQSCGCSTTTPACTFSRYAIKPNGRWSTVYSAGVLRMEPFVTITLVDDRGVNTLFSGLLAPGVGLVTDDLVVTLAGSFASSLTLAPPTYVLQTQDTQSDSYAGTIILVSGPVSTPGQPIRNSVGDVQSAVPGYFATTDIVFDNAIATCTQSNYDSCAFTTPGIDQMFTAGIEGFNSMKCLFSTDANYCGGGKGAVAHNGVAWSPDFDPITGLVSVITATVPSTSGMLLTLQTPRPLLYTITESVICPVAPLPQTVVLSGCYSCANGAMVTIKSGVCSSCDDGTVIVTSTGNFKVSDSVIYLSQNCDFTADDSEVSIGILSGDSHISGSLIFTSGVKSVTVPISGTLAAPTVSFSNNSYIEGVAETGAGPNPLSVELSTDLSDKLPSFWSGLGSIFGNSGSWVTAIFGLIAVVLAIGLSALTSFFLLKRALNCACSKTKKN